MLNVRLLFVRFNPTMIFRNSANFVRFLSNSLRNYSARRSLVNLIINEKSGIATATLQRPPVNCLNLELWNELSSTLTEVEKKKCKGFKHTVFSAGIDIFEIYKPDPKRFAQLWTLVQQTWMQLYGTSYPTVAVINGHAIAGGCLLAVSCEYRIMLKNFTIGVNETQIGLVPPSWFIAVMANVIGHRQTELALTTSKLFSTDEALNIGLIDEMVTTKEEGIQKAEIFLERFAKISPSVRAVTKKSLRELEIQILANNPQKDLDNFFSQIRKEKVQEALKMYLDTLKQKQ